MVPKSEYDLVVAQNDTLETKYQLIFDRLATLDQAYSHQIASLQSVIDAFPDTNDVIARYKVIRDEQVNVMLKQIDSAVVGYIRKLVPDWYPGYPLLDVYPSWRSNNFRTIKF